MHRVMYTNASQYVSNRDGVFYYIRRVPHDVRQHYASSRISFSLRTKSLSSAARAASSVTQRLEDYWLGLRLQQMDIPAIHLVKADDVEDNSPLLLDAVEMYLKTKGKTDKTLSGQQDVTPHMWPRCWVTGQSHHMPPPKLQSSVIGVLNRA